MDTISSRIKDSRKKIGLTQEALGKACGGLTRATISKLEKDDSNTIPSGTTLVQLSMALGVTERWIITGNNPDNLQEPLYQLNNIEKRMLILFKGLSLVEQNIGINLIEALKK